MLHTELWDVWMIDKCWLDETSSFGPALGDKNIGQIYVMSK